MPLDEYARKRRFDKTPEPSGAAKKPGPKKKSPPRAKAEPSKTADPKRSFVIQKHDASRLHYDFRLELDGVLVSWAVPKGPSLDPHDKRLAVHVEDHPLDYASFEGTIPEGEYGGGAVIVWDRGWWEPQPKEAYQGASRATPEPTERLAKGDLKLTLHGEKLQGGWMLVRMKPRENERAENWLLIKENDEFARPAADVDILKERPESAASGLTIEQVAEAASASAANPVDDADPDARATDAKSPAVWHSRPRSRRKRPEPKRPGGRAEALIGPGSDPLPADAPLQLATLVSEAPEGEDWIHEVKYDGYRVEAVLEKGQARMITRNGKDWTAVFAPIAAALEALPVSSAMLDGEVVAFDSAGVSDFSTLQEAIASKHAERLAYVLFDLLYVEGHDLRSAPLLKRKDLLRALLETQPETSFLRYADHYAERGSEFQQEACAMGLEGSVSKRGDRPHQAGRTRDWLKVKCKKEQEFVIGGFTEPGGARKGFGALLLGVYSPAGELRYTGRVGTGFNERMLTDLRTRLDSLEIDEPRFANPPRLSGETHWVRPELVGEVEFAEWTRAGTLRQPSFKGLREDKAPVEVTFEIAEATEGPPTGASMRSASAGGSAPSGLPAAAWSASGSKPDRPRPSRKGQFGKDIAVAGVKITNPDKLLFEDSPLSKIELVYYYEKVAPFLLEHVANRPLTLVRCPIGRGKGCFYQKHPDDGMSSALKTLTIEERGGPALYMWFDDVAGLLSLAQLGVLEIHTWGSCVKEPYKPDRLIFDLDPAPDVPWRRVVDTAFMARERLESLGFTPFVKTTGGKGLHVVIPVEPALEYGEARAWTKAFVDSIVAEDPTRLTGKMAKKLRPGKVFVDYVRNAQGATAVAPYSTRARPGAPIAVPIEWDELRQGLDPKKFTAEKVLNRLADQGDPWAGMEKARAAARVLKAAASAASR